MSRFLFSSISGILFKNIIFQPNTLSKLQQVRTTYILKRTWEPYLSRKGGSLRKLQKKNKVYELVENTDSVEKFVKLILTKDVAGVGSAGDVVELRENKARLQIYHKYAIYASPENLAKLEEEKKMGLIPQKTNSSIWAPLTAQMLSVFTLTVIMHLENPWVLQPWHIRVSFRKAGLFVPDHAIELPTKEISGPNLEYESKEFPVKVTINNNESAYVRCRIHHWTSNESKQLQPIPDHWKFAAEPIFPEVKELLDSLPVPPFFISVKQ